MIFRAVLTVALHYTTLRLALGQRGHRSPQEILLAAHEGARLRAASLNMLLPCLLFAFHSSTSCHFRSQHIAFRAFMDISRRHLL